MSTQIRHCSSAYVLEMLISHGNISTKDCSPNCGLTILHIRNAISEMVFSRQCLKRRKKDKTKLDLSVNTNFGLEGMANI